MTSPERRSLYGLTVSHGDDMGAADFRVLATMRRTLLGLMSHGFIGALETHADSTTTTWSFEAGSEDPGEILAGLVDTVKTLAPWWAWTLKSEW